MSDPAGRDIDALRDEAVVRAIVAAVEVYNSPPKWVGGNFSGHWESVSERRERMKVEALAALRAEAGK